MKRPAHRRSRKLPLASAALAALLAVQGCRAGDAPDLERFAGGPGARAEGDGWLEAPPSAEATRPVHVLDERARAATVGLDADLLGEALARGATLPRLHNVIVARHGEVVAERHYRGPGLDRPANVKSASKSILSALVGVAIAEGHLEGAEQPVVPFFARYLDAEQAAERSGITVGHLLSMRSGLQSTSNANYGRWVTSPDWVRHAITRPMLTGPGERRMYSTGSTHLVSAVLTQATGRSTFELARAYLAEPLGITMPAWPRDPQGIYFGGNDMLVSPRGLLRFGEMYRNGGVFEGRQVVPERWVRDSWEMLAVPSRGGWGGSNRGYGLGWWGRESNGYQIRFAWGYGGQFVFIVPALELTVVFTSDPVSPREGPHNNALHRMIDELLVPAAMTGAGSAAGSAAAELEAPPLG